MDRPRVPVPLVVELEARPLEVPAEGVGVDYPLPQFLLQWLLVPPPVDATPPRPRARSVVAYVGPVVKGLRFSKPLHQ